MKKLESLYNKIENLVVMDSLIKSRSSRVLIGKYSSNESVIVLGPSNEIWLVISIIDDRYSLICKHYELKCKLNELGYSTSDRTNNEEGFFKFLETIFSLEGF